MSFKSPTRPRCVCCDKPIPKVTGMLYFGQSADRSDRYSRCFAAKPADKAAAQRLVNEQIISVRYWDYQGERYISMASTWDGESYKDQYFCGDACARDLGYAMARLGWKLKASA